MRKLSVAALLTALVLVGTVPAGATTYLVSARDNYFSPGARAAAMGSTINFKNTGESTHTTTIARGLLGGWNKWLAPGESFAKVVPYAGTFVYYCVPHGSATSGMRGTITVPTRVSPTSGTRATTFTVRLATVNAPSGWVYDVQLRKNSGSWATWRTGRTTATTTFKAASAGTYAFRTRLRRLSNNAASDYSPYVRVTVK